MDAAYIVALGAVAAGFVQGLSGFAFGLVAMSFWAWTLQPQLASVLAVFGALVGQILAAATIRRGFDGKALAPFIAGGLVGIPIGASLLPFLDMHLFKAALGALLIVWCPVMLFARRLPPLTLGGRLCDGIVGMIGGILSGIGGFSGMVPTLWCTLRRVDRETQRSVVQNFNLAMLACAMAAYVAKGIVTPAMLPMFAVEVAAMLVPTLLGTRLYIGLSEAAFRSVVLMLLTASGVAMLVSSAPHLLRY